MSHLKLALAGNSPASSGDTQKDLLRAFLTESNKTSTTGGATTLKPDILKKISGEENFSMNSWLANRNRSLEHEEVSEKEEEGTECKHRKIKSGILDKATANTYHKEIWPQKNLLEDWADEEIEFKNMTFEHYVAGEIRTIELCKEPAQIITRMQLMRQIAYARLRGYEWSLVRKMYAAILRAIETKDLRWGENLDRFEKILYRRTLGNTKMKDGQSDI